MTYMIINQLLIKNMTYKKLSTCWGVSVHTATTIITIVTIAAFAVPKNQINFERIMKMLL